MPSCSHSAREWSFVGTSSTFGNSPIIECGACGHRWIGDDEELGEMRNTQRDHLPDGFHLADRHYG